MTFRALPSKFPTMEALSLLTRPEGKTLEFKRDLSSPDRVIRTLVAFANTAGGTLLVGVEDKTRRVLGVADPLTEEERVANLIAHSITPRLVPEIEILPWRRTHLLAVHIYPEWTSPHYVSKLGPESGVFIRVGSTNREADPAIIAELKRNAGTESYDEYPVPQLNPDDLDISIAKKLFDGIRAFGPRDLRTLKLTTTHRGRTVPTVGGLLLIGKDRFDRFPDAYIKVARFDGSTRSRVLDMKEIRAPLPQMVDETVAFVAKHMTRAVAFGGTRRIERWTYPPEAVREAVVNSILHADYSQVGGPIRLAVYDERLEVENPGLLPAGVTIEDLRRGVSKPRNRVIARFFHEIRLAEQWGSGIPRMTEACTAAGLPEPELEEFATHFRVTLHTGGSEARKHLPPGRTVGQLASARDSAILELLSEFKDTGGASAHELAARLGVTDRTVRSKMARLVDEGRAVAIGSGPHDPRRRYFAVTEPKPAVEDDK